MHLERVWKMTEIELECLTDQVSISAVGTVPAARAGTNRRQDAGAPRETARAPSAFSKHALRLVQCWLLNWTLIVGGHELH